MSGALKDFFDRTYYGVIDKTDGLPYCLYIRAGHDGTGQRRGVETIVTGLRRPAWQEPLLCRGQRSARRRVGEEWGSTCRSRVSPGHSKKTKKKQLSTIN